MLVYKKEGSVILRKPISDDQLTTDQLVEKGRKIEEHLLQKFPGHQEIRECCGIMAPNKGLCFHTQDILMGCHPNHQQEIPPGKYRVKEVLFGGGAYSNHSILVVNIETEEEYILSVGYLSSGKIFDWRGVRRLVEE